MYGVFFFIRVIMDLSRLEDSRADRSLTLRFFLDKWRRSLDGFDNRKERQGGTAGNEKSREQNSYVLVGSFGKGFLRMGGLVTGSNARPGSVREALLLLDVFSLPLASPPRFEGGRRLWIVVRGRSRNGSRGGDVGYLIAHGIAPETPF